MPPAIQESHKYTHSALGLQTELPAVIPALARCQGLSQEQLGWGAERWRRKGSRAIAGAKTEAGRAVWVCAWRLSCHPARQKLALLAREL